MTQTERIWHRKSGHAPRPALALKTPSRFSSSAEGDISSPRFIPHSEEEARQHTSFLLVTTIPFATAKGTFLTNIEWCSAVRPSENGDVGGGTRRVRMLVEREPIDGAQAHDRAEILARRYAVPIVLVVTPLPL